MAAVDHVAQRRDLARRLALEPDPPHAFAIDPGRLLAPAQIGDGLRPVGGRHPERDALAGAAAVETEHEAGPLGRAAVNERIDAQRPVGAGQAGLDALAEIEAGPPHQRAIAEHPKVFGRHVRDRVPWRQGDPVQDLPDICSGACIGPEPQ